MPLTLPLNPVVFIRGANGIPDTQLYAQLGGQMDAYMQTTTATFGFESMVATLTLPLSEALLWLDCLMYSCVVYGPEAQIVWEGYLRQVELTIGQERRTLSLDDMANRVTVRYTTVLGTPGSSGSASDTASQALYGVKDAVLSLNQSTAADAALLRTAALAEMKNPRMDSATAAATGELGEVRLDLTFEGWYGTLGWVVTSRSSTTNTDVATQIGALIATSGVGIGVTNAFLSTSTANIASTGNSATEKIEADTTYRQKIEALLSLANSSNQRLAWGVYEDRKLTVKQWAGATPETVTYFRSLGDDQIYNASGGVYQPWDVRPDAMYQTIELVPTGPLSTAQDAAARHYVERVTFQVDENGWRVELEPTADTSLDALLARLTR